MEVSAGSFITNSEPTWGMIHVLFDWSVEEQYIASNQTIINWSIRVGGTTTKWYEAAPFTVIIDGRTVYSSTARIKVFVGDEIASGTYTLTHDDDGSRTFSASVSAAIYASSVNCTGAGTWILPTIARESTLTFSSGILGVEQILTINRHSDSFKHKIICRDIEIDCGSEISIPFTPDIEWSRYNTNGSNIASYIKIYTYQSDGKQVGSGKQFPIIHEIPDSVVPKVLDFVIQDQAEMFDKFGCYVQGQSKLQVAVVAAGSYGSTITSYRIMADGKVYTENNITVDSVISGSGELVVSAMVTDSRGRSTSGSVKITVLPYRRPQISSLTAVRCKAIDDPTPLKSGEYMAVKFSATVSSLGEKNTAAYTVKYKKVKDLIGSYVEHSVGDYEGVYDVSDGVYIFPAEKASSYNIILIAEDSIQESVPATTRGSSIQKLWSFFKNVGITLGAVAEKPGLQVHMDSEFHGDVSCKGTVLVGDENILHYADSFTQRGAKDNYISNVLLINTDGNMNSAYMQDGYINSNTLYVSDMVSAIDDQGYVAENIHGYRKVHVIPNSEGETPYIMVEVLEVYPAYGRTYHNVYNGEFWSGWQIDSEDGGDPSSEMEHLTNLEIEAILQTE